MKCGKISATTTAMIVYEFLTSISLFPITPTVSFLPLPTPGYQAVAQVIFQFHLLL